MATEFKEECKKRHSLPLTSSHKNKLKILFLVIIVNLITVYVFRSTVLPSGAGEENRLVAALLRQLNSTHDQIADLERKLTASNLLAESLLRHLSSGNAGVGDSGSEVSVAVGSHKLPLGRYSKSDSDSLFPSIGAGCLDNPDHLLKYMSYEVGGECPSDDVFAQKLLLKGCEPLPRRRCKPKSPKGYVDPTPFPESLWATPADASIVWDPYTCKSYDCLVEREKRPGVYDCKDCFNLNGREKHRWMVDNGALDFGIQEVLAVKPPGTVRIGLDIGGGSGTFAARMRERNITIITSSMNFDGPFNSFIASRGLIPVHVSVSERFPFFDNTLDIVHSMHVLSNWIPDVMLEFMLYDVYRVLRPGGLFWLDRFFCRDEQLNRTYVPMIERLGFNKLRWFTGKKADRGGKQWYLSALLEKPMT
ncbi:hypothetical protein V2J09_007156 [Rumex salicifolius]